MPPVQALLPEGATALQIPTDADRPEHVTVHPNWPVDGAYEQRFAYAHITPATASCRAEPGPFIRRVFRTLALDLPQTFEVLPTDGDADVAVRFRTPAEREAAMRRQPFELDGATVTLSRDEGVTVVPDAPDGRHRYMVHVALHEYPIEQRNTKDIGHNCRRFGFLREVDPAQFGAPDLATVRVVFQVEHPRETPHEIIIEYFDGTTSRVPVEIVSVWDRSKSYDASGRYVRLFLVPDAILRFVSSAMATMLNVKK